MVPNERQKSTRANKFLIEAIFDGFIEKVKLEKD
jgi:hypothetical protein